MRAADAPEAGTSGDDQRGLATGAVEHTDDPGGFLSNCVFGRLVPVEMSRQRWSEMTGANVTEPRYADVFTLTSWPLATTPADTLVSSVAVFRSPRVGGRLDADTITGCREIVRLDQCRTRGDLLAALVDAAAIDLETVRRVLTRHGWPTTLDLAAAVSEAYAFVVEQRRVFLVDELVSARTIATHRAVLAELIELERRVA